MHSSNGTVSLLPSTAVVGKGTDTFDSLPLKKLVAGNNNNKEYTTTHHWISKSNSLGVEDNNNKKTVRE